MSHDNHDVCRGLLEWMQVGGMLVRIGGRYDARRGKWVHGMFEARCTKCGGKIKRDRRPSRQGMKCRRLTPKEKPRSMRCV